MQPPLDYHLLELARLEGTDDGLVVRVKHNRQKRVLKVILRCGDSRMGYYGLELTYLQAEILPDDNATLARIARSTIEANCHGCDLACHEVDSVDDGRIEHRFIFHTSPWVRTGDERFWLFTVKCQELQWHKLPRKSQALTPMADRYHGGPGS